MARSSGLTGEQRDRVIWQLRQRRHSYQKIARYLNISVGTVRASLSRTAQRLYPHMQPTDWDADLR